MTPDQDIGKFPMHAWWAIANFQKSMVDNPQALSLYDDWRHSTRSLMFGRTANSLYKDLWGRIFQASSDHHHTNLPLIHRIATRLQSSLTSINRPTSTGHHARTLTNSYPTPDTPCTHLNRGTSCCPSTYRPAFEHLSPRGR